MRYNPPFADKENWNFTGTLTSYTAYANDPSVFRCSVRVVDAKKHSNLKKGRIILLNDGYMCSRVLNNSCIGKTFNFIGSTDWKHALGKNDQGVYFNNIEKAIEVKVEYTIQLPVFARTDRTFGRTTHARVFDIAAAWAKDDVRIKGRIFRTEEEKRVQYLGVLGEHLGNTLYKEFALENSIQVISSINSYSPQTEGDISFYSSPNHFIFSSEVKSRKDREGYGCGIHLNNLYDAEGNRKIDFIIFFRIRLMPNGEDIDILYCVGAMTLEDFEERKSLYEKQADEASTLYHADCGDFLISDIDTHWRELDSVFLEMVARHVSED